MVIAAAGSVSLQAASGEVDVALGAAVVAVLACGIFFAGSYALGVLIRALWHAVVRKGKSDAV